MPSELPRLKDRAPIYGQNSRDDEKDLREGEVVKLVNAYPGNPPIPRKGCKHHRVINTDDYDYASHAISYVTTSGNKYAVVWVKDGTDYLLLKINLTTYLRTILGTATGLTDPAFRFIHIFDYLYTVCDEDMTWDSSVQSTRHKIIEIGDEEEGESDTVREMCINVAPEVESIEVISGDTFYTGYMSYAFSFVRHTVSEAFDSDGVPQAVTSFYPGVSEGPENILKRKVGGVGTGPEDPDTFGIRINLQSGDVTPNNVYANEQGATHIRIHRTRTQTSEALASAATHYFLIDVPIPLEFVPKTIEDIELENNNAKVNIFGHGLDSGLALFGKWQGTETKWPVGDTDLDAQIKTLLKLNNDVLEIVGSEGESYSFLPTDTGYLSQDYVVFSEIDLLTSSKVRVVTSTAHGWNTNDVVMITGVSGGDGQSLFTPVADRKTYNKWFQRSTDGKWIIVEDRCSSYTRLNNATYTITKIDDTTIELQDTDVDDFKYPFINTAGAPSILYTEADKVPPMGGGYVASSLKAIDSMLTPTNKVVVVTEGKHGLLDGDSVILNDIVGSTELNDNSYTILVLSEYRIELQVSTTGISAYISGGTLTPSLGGMIYEDTITDNTLAGETAQLLTTTYSPGPKAGFCEYAKTRMWLFGLISTEKGRAYYSEVPGGAGATPIDAAHTYPQKFLNMFHYDYFIDFSVKKGYLPTGIKRLSDDLFFFFEGEIYALFGSDPTLASPTLISEEIGCAFPDTLIIGELPKYGGQCLLYLSNLGPAITKQGGETFLFTDFKIAELWPDVNRELYDDLLDQREHIIHHCTAKYWDNTWWISYETNSGEKKVWSYYFNPEIKFEPKSAHGPFELDLAEVG